MPTLLTGIPRESGKGSGGLLSLYITELSNLTGSTPSASAGIATITSPAGVWKKFVLGKESGSNFTSTLAASAANNSIVYNQVVTSIFKRNQVAKRNELKVLAQNELVCVISDNNNIASSGVTSGATVYGDLYIIGLPIENCAGGCDVTGAVSTTGAQFADANNMTLTITAIETFPPLSISAGDFYKIANGLAV
jgi:hypothetical protein